MKRPVILITGGQAYDRQFHSESYVLNQSYTAAILKAGGLPIMPLDFDSLDEYVEMADGLICSGTHEFSPLPEMLSRDEHEKRNAREQKLMQKFIATGKPILGICLGLQRLNVVFGGTLKNRFSLSDGVEHYMTSHEARTEPDSILRRLYGESFLINSYHSNRLDQLAPVLRATAFSPDGVIEAFEHETKPIYGFQFHPERMRGDHPVPLNGPDMTQIFDEFIKLCMEK